MDKNVFLTGEGARQFSNALELLNTSIKEFNQIADKMIPEGLLKEGLSAYLQEFCMNLEAEEALKTEYRSNTENVRASEEVEIALFRCFRNILILFVRFSQPTFIRVQLDRSEQSLSLVIRDDGRQNIFKNPANPVSQELQNVNAILQACHGLLRMNTFQTSGNEIELLVPV